MQSNRKFTPETSASHTTPQNKGKARRISTAQGHRTSNRAYRMGLKYACRNKAEQDTNMFGSKRSQRSYQMRALPDADNRRDSHSP